MGKEIVMWTVFLYGIVLALRCCLAYCGSRHHPKSITSEREEKHRLEIKGQVEEIVYQNEENGYTVCHLDMDEKLLTAVGYLPFVSVGDMIVARGTLVNHAVYGEQFKIQSFEKVMPSSMAEVEKYLGSGIIKGVGPVTSKKIVDHFGEETIYVLRFTPEKLVEVHGITPSKATQIAEEFQKEWELWQIVMFLQTYGIGVTNANRVYKALGIHAIDSIKSNPYCLLPILYGADFHTIDQMAIHLGIDFDSSFRVASGIQYALQVASRNGHTCTIHEELIKFVSQLLGVPEEVVEREITALAYAKSIYVEKDRVFLKAYYEAEDTIARRVMMMCNDRVKPCPNLEKKIKEQEQQLKIDLSEKQRKAIHMVFQNKISIITGGPGTGKTTLIRILIRLMQVEKMEIALCAPTGRAAKRITETTGEEAKTLHRLLALGKTEEDGITIPYEIPKIEKDVVIVDEMSMVDTVLFHFLMRGLLDKTRLVLIGDSDQLPSVGAGNVLKDLMESEFVPTIKLTEIYRQARESQIVVNAHKINEGEQIDLTSRDGDCFFIKRTNNVQQICELASDRLKAYGNYDPMQDIQVLTPTKKGDFGTKNLNKELQRVLNPKSPFKKEKEFGSVIFREGDKVMQTKNNYDIYWESKDGKNYGSGVFNGDMGTIQSISEEGMEVCFDEDKIVAYDATNYEELEHAYAITIHKSQGSEFPVVVMPLLNGPPMLYTRNVLYTGVTRAKELLVMVGDEAVIRHMIENNHTKRRNTGLQDKFEKYMQIFQKV